ncbi:NAD(P)-dependent dehydrogenase, short-chain alcohol dehydrogenase family [Marinobacter daqiaonensis]|uniref:NAD(P)-dependent dehydrogenase, short-chain alcohol dehydrogenase family n=1 Tax=Marinobacter daqiaonensis TaxID=650891 RepID=A0A1I6IMZ8_9GAMM|nr:glucose 1-dehydrogenase [Marinobacter daqiaonensis]SFR68086.1 NAD(P)-dependent dehydrogenase, short-chain alcohol dehydrogenase family [Marinobacter daqiaonensis]
MAFQLSSDLTSAFSLEGKVALITGSTMGIGEGTARVLAQAGAHVIISSRKQDECEAVAARFRELGLSAEGRACHIGRMEDIEAMAAYLQEHGGLDILVNNAVLSPWRTIEDTDVGLFTKTVEVDLRGYWFLSVEAVKLMRPRGGGSIINLASVAALHPDRMLSLYSTLKTALIGMSRSFALEFGGEGIRVNTILPGVIQTKLAEAFDAETKKRIVEKTTVKRLGEPEDIGYSVLYLCSRAGAYVSGTNLVVDGGFSVALM